MSVILDALQKARNSETVHGLSRALEPHRTGRYTFPQQKSSLRSILLFFILGMTLLLVVLFAGAVYLLYARDGAPERLSKIASAVRRVELNGPVLSAAAPLDFTTSATAAAFAAELPAPVPLAELTAPASGQALPPPPSVTPVPAIVVAPPVSATSLKLGTILCDGTDCIALINGRTMRVGEKIRDHKVLEITSIQVTLQRGAETPVILSSVE